MSITIYDIDVCPRTSDDDKVVLVRQLKAMILDECRKSEFPASSFFRIIQIIEDAEGLPINKRTTPFYTKLNQEKMIVDYLTETENCILRQLLEDELGRMFIRKTLAIAYRGILNKLRGE